MSAMHRKEYANETEMLFDLEKRLEALEAKAVEPHERLEALEKAALDDEVKAINEVYLLQIQHIWQNIFMDAAGHYELSTKTVDMGRFMIGVRLAREVRDAAIAALESKVTSSSSGDR